jgi:type II secretory pathway pseudopilin PulG
MMKPTDRHIPSSHARERGSVLVVVVGVLAVLAMMATAFISVMQMQKATGVNVRRAMHAEMAAKTGLASALQQIMSTHRDISITYSSPLQGWSSLFRGTTTTYTYSDLAPSPLTADLYPHTSGTAFDADVLSLGPIETDDIISEASSRSYKLHYSVMTIDLAGRLYANYDGAGLSDREEQFAALVSNELMETGGPGKDDTAAQNLYAAQVLSHLQSEYVYETDYSGGTPSTYFNTMTSPWGDTTLGNDPNVAPLNFNSIPLRLRNSWYIYLSDYFHRFSADVDSTDNVGLPAIDNLQADDGKDFAGGTTYLPAYEVGTTPTPQPSPSEFEAIGPLADSDTYWLRTDRVTGSEHSFSGHALNTPYDGTDYHAEIAEAMWNALETCKVDDTLDRTNLLPKINEEFLTRLGSTGSSMLDVFHDLRDIYNQEWTWDGTAGEWQPNTASIQRSARMERAINQALLALNSNNAIYDFDGSAQTFSWASNAAGNYVYDLHKPVSWGGSIPDVDIENAYALGDTEAEHGATSATGYDPDRKSVV